MSYREGMSSADIDLFTAASKARLDGVLLALKKGARADAIDGDGRSPLHAIALATGPEATLEAFGGIIQALLSAGADAEFQSSGGRTPLLWAARYLNAPAVAALIDAGCSIKGALFEAASSSGDPEIIALLLRHGADPFERGPNGLTPLQAARASWGRGDLASIAMLEAAELQCELAAPAAAKPPRL